VLAAANAHPLIILTELTWCEIPLFFHAFLYRYRVGCIVLWSVKFVLTQCVVSVLFLSLKSTTCYLNTSLLLLNRNQWQNAAHFIDACLISVDCALRTLTSRRNKKFSCWNTAIQVRRVSLETFAFTLFWNFLLCSNVLIKIWLFEDWQTRFLFLSPIMIGRGSWCQLRVCCWVLPLVLTVDYVFFISVRIVHAAMTSVKRTKAFI